MVKHELEMEKELRSRMRDGAGETEIIHVFKGEEIKGKCRLIAKVRLKPGCSIGYHTHDKEEELYFILSGTASVDDNGTVKQLVPGDASLTGNGAGHSIANNGKEVLEFMAIILLY